MGNTSERVRIVVRKTRTISPIHEGKENNTGSLRVVSRLETIKRYRIYIYLFEIKYHRYLMLLDKMYTQIIVRIKIFSHYYHR